MFLQKDRQRTVSRLRRELVEYPDWVGSVAAKEKVKNGQVAQSR